MVTIRPTVSTDAPNLSATSTPLFHAAAAAAILSYHGEPRRAARYSSYTGRARLRLTPIQCLLVRPAGGPRGAFTACVA